MAGDNRLFVPLDTLYYRLFESGAKTWELRGVCPRFNRDTVYPGRIVELRRGYNTGDSMFGEIGEVRVWDSVGAIGDHTRFSPGSTREEFEESVGDLLGQYDRFIGFEVKLGDEH